jgi:hypothetical protein
MSSVVISGDTSGAITLSAPAVAGTNTITLPAATGTVMVSGNMPAFSAYRLTGSQSVSNATQTAAALDTKLFDTATCFNNTGSTVTLNGLSTPAYSFCPNVAGYYQVNGRIDTYASAGLNFGQVNIYKNGTAYKNGGLINIATIGEIALNASCLVYLNGTGDYVTLYGFVNGSAGQVFLAGINNLWFDGVLVRAA